MHQQGRVGWVGWDGEGPDGGSRLTFFQDRDISSTSLYSAGLFKIKERDRSIDRSSDLLGKPGWI
ncbi:predicted protein [Uncinocarpus reesii 1704]|uniref:Uncharacterized protein n=1 Tax=Uncinocarpus reesii (strain UAMH 1704) TaxID=336963 RepID=C4JX84_UNCRE|nr:uncharacterized protein UREG_06257 [Uncinocarpus reesii 1704]EEP81392.1 predicted protein [Uncinocarpus reesii 1704]